jgi:hypothetical protein
MLQRALMSGSLNLGSQLAQEGSEGDFSGLSLGLAGLQGALTAPDAADTLRGMTTAGSPEYAALGEAAGAADIAGNIDLAGAALADQATMLADRSLLTKAADVGLGSLAKGAEFLGKGVDILGPGGTEPGLNLATLEAAALPVTQATGDLAFADAQRALRDYENEMANQDQLSLIDDEGRRRAIRAAMEAAGHLEEVIVDTLAELGLKQGGIVGMKHGGQLVKRGPGRPGYAGDYSWAKKQYLIDLQDGLIPSDTTFSEWLENNAPDPDHDKIYAKGGRINKEGGGVASVLPKGKEMDYRGGGVIPMGSRERADDVPARLSKNEFVMTADAVRAAGGGSINKGAKRMYNLMHNLEARV